VSGTGGRVSPPAVSRRVVEWAARRCRFGEMVSDVDEIWRERAARDGLLRARWWYRRQALLAVGRSMLWSGSSELVQVTVRTRLQLGRRRAVQALRCAASCVRARWACHSRSHWVSAWLRRRSLPCATGKAWCRPEGNGCRPATSRVSV